MVSTYYSREDLLRQGNTSSQEEDEEGYKLGEINSKE